MNNPLISSAMEGTSEVTTETAYNGENDSRYTDPEEVYPYLDYKDYEGEKDTRYGAEYSWVSTDTKVKKQKKYVSQSVYKVTKIRNWEGILPKS
ncbi:MAG: hypothetical protein WCD89_10035 [Anaerocolumna sp.]